MPTVAVQIDVCTGRCFSCIFFFFLSNNKQTKFQKTEAYILGFRFRLFCNPPAQNTLHLKSLFLQKELFLQSAKCTTLQGAHPPSPVARYTV